eukprot:359565-Chlamydomonas_euryale.AAC.2
MAGTTARRRRRRWSWRGLPRSRWSRRRILTRRAGWTARLFGCAQSLATTARTTPPRSTCGRSCPSSRSSCSTCGARNLCRCAVERGRGQAGKVAVKGGDGRGRARVRGVEGPREGLEDDLGGALEGYERSGDHSAKEEV